MKVKHILWLLSLFALVALLTACPSSPPPEQTAKLTVALAGTGSGTVTSTPTGIDCGDDCNADYDVNKEVTLSAEADSGSEFAGWSGACTGTENCVVTMNVAKTVTATFNTSGGNGDTNYTLTVVKDVASTGTGTITSDPAGIDCGDDCTEDFAAGTTVTLTAAADEDGTVTFSNDCTPVTGDDTKCTVDMNEATTVTATFNAAGVNTFALTVATDGTGSGTVTSDDTNINCGTAGTENTDCTATYTEADPAITVTLTATPTNSDSVFAGFTGCTPGTTANVCTVTMDMAQSVTATFNNNTGDPVLTINKLGNGGSQHRVFVNSLEYFGPKAFSENSEVTIRSIPTQGATSSFLGWGGACSTYNASQDCVIIITDDTTVEAIYSDGTEGRASSAVAAQEDDAEEFLNDFTSGTSTVLRGTVQTDSSDLDLAYDATFNVGVIAGVRFAGLDSLPANADILYAYIQFRAQANSPSSGSQVELLIRGEDQDTAGSFAEISGNLSARPKTTASVTWQPETWQQGSDNPERKRTTNLAPIVEEIISRAAWDGETMAFFISPPLNPDYDSGQPISDTNQQYLINTLDYRAATANSTTTPELVIIYETPASE